MCSVAEAAARPSSTATFPGPARDDSPRRSRRRRKETLLPEITRLALEGHTGQAIARQVGLPKRTVNHWLRELRQEWTAKAAEGAGEMFAVELARLDSIYREAMEAWRKSQTDIQVRLVEQIEAAGGEPRKRRSVRTQSQRGNAALLTRAMAAVMASCRLKGQIVPSAAADLDEGASPAETTLEDGVQIPKPGTIAAERWWLEVSADSVPMMTPGELYEVAWRLGNVIEAEGGTVPPELEKQNLEQMRVTSFARCVAG